MKKQEIISNLIISRLTEIAKPVSLDQRKEKKDLSWLCEAEIDKIDGLTIYASVNFADTDIWYNYELELRDVVAHFYEVNEWEALVEFDIEGNNRAWVSVFDVEILDSDVLDYLIDNAELSNYTKIIQTQNF